MKKGEACLLFIVFLLLNASFSMALNDGLCAIATVTDIEPTSIEADEDFTVGIGIENCGDKIPENITFEITRYSLDIQIKEPVVVSVGELSYLNSKRFFVFHMRSSPDIAPGFYNFETKLTYGNSQRNIIQNGNFSVSVLNHDPKLTVAGIKTEPEKISEGDDFVLSLKIENYGKGSAKNVRVKFEGLQMNGVKEAYLGEIKPSENLPARFVLKDGKAGEQEYTIKILYEQYGQEKSREIKLNMYVFEKERYTKYVLIGLAAIVILVILFLIFRKNKPK